MQKQVQVQQVPSRLVYEGEQVSLVCAGAWTALGTYSWKKDGALLSEVTNTLAFLSVSRANAAHYACTFIDSAGSNKSDSEILSVGCMLYASLLLCFFASCFCICRTSFFAFSISSSSFLRVCLLQHHLIMFRLSSPCS